MTVVASRFARQKNDLYQTHPWATKAALRHLDVKGRKVWEPAAGNHKIADVLGGHGASVTTSDITTYERPHDFLFDFLKFGPAPETGADIIFTNPPYGRDNIDAELFARLSLERCAGYVALLLTAKFDFGKTRTDLFRDNPRFMFKIALIDRIKWFPGRYGNTENHAWFVWGPGSYAVKQTLWEEHL